jgi:FtsP/CotA-like multicopper oxidase with cupredoxin domain
MLEGLGTAGIAAGGAGLWWSLNSRYSPAAGTDLAQPGELRSSNGRLQVRLEAAPGTVQLGGGQASALGYNGGVPGPTLRVRAGDVLNVELVNRLAVPTNLHVHGLHVSPQGNGDNVFVAVDPGNSFSYEYRLPADHPPGVYWYHPHHHGMVADQVFAGLFGAIIVEDADSMDVSREQVLVISDITLDGSGTIPDASSTDRMLGREGEIVLVNGQSAPKLSARPGERERWRIVNTCVARYLRLDGQQIQLLGMDSGRFRTPGNVEELLLAPGNRADLLVTAAAGDSTFTSVFYDRGGMPGMAGRTGRSPSGGQGQGKIPLATFAVSGESAAPPPAEPRPAGT